MVVGKGGKCTSAVAHFGSTGSPDLGLETFVGLDGVQVQIGEIESVEGAGEV